MRYSIIGIVVRCIAFSKEATGERVPFGLIRERSDEEDPRRELARAMRDEGKSYRQIADELGYKSPASVHNLLK